MCARCRTVIRTKGPPPNFCEEKQGGCGKVNVDYETKSRKAKTIFHKLVLVIENDPRPRPNPIKIEDPIKLGITSDEPEKQIIELLMDGIHTPRPNGDRLIGEEYNSMLSLLCCVSTLCFPSTNLAVLGQSGTGKTVIIMGVEQILPREWVTVSGIPLVSQFSEKALKYLGKRRVSENGEPTKVEVNLSGKVIVMIDDSGDQTAFLDQIKPLLSHDREEVSIFISPTGGEKAGTIFIIHGWPSVIRVSTDAKSETEISGRFLTISPNKPDQKLIISDRCKRYQYGIGPDYDVIGKCQSYLNSLKPVNVIIPFDLESTWPDGEQSLRHHAKCMSLIENVACLFQHWRPWLDADTIIATQGDVLFALHLMEPLMKSMIHNVPPDIIKFYNMMEASGEFGGVFNTKDVEHFAKNQNISRPTFYRTYWKSIKDFMLYETEAPDGQNKKYNYYVMPNEVSPVSTGIRSVIPLQSQWLQEFCIQKGLQVSQISVYTGSNLKPEEIVHILNTSYTHIYDTFDTSMYNLTERLIKTGVLEVSGSEIPNDTYDTQNAKSVGSDKKGLDIYSDNARSEHFTDDEWAKN
jgi:hypothetical protein